VGLAAQTASSALVRAYALRLLLVRDERTHQQNYRDVRQRIVFNGANLIPIANGHEHVRQNRGRSTICGLQPVSTAIMIPWSLRARSTIFWILLL
jgi:hypothetical protein